MSKIRFAVSEEYDNNKIKHENQFVIISQDSLDKFDDSLFVKFSKPRTKVA